jgi:two-component system cell cycle response regulator
MPDRIGRYGGIEFLLVLPETDLDDSCMIADRIRATVSESDFDIGKQKINVTICIGATQFRPGDDLQQLLNRADEAVSEAKQSGRNRVVGKQ